MKNYENEETLNMGVQNFTVNNWVVRTLSNQITLAEDEIKHLVACASDWSTAFVENHQNYFRSQFGAPSSVIRFDYVLDSNGFPRVFEVEDRPAGIEINALCNPRMFDLFIESLKEYSIYTGKPIGICVSPGRMFNSDEFVWVQRVRDIPNFKVVLGDVPRNPETHLWLVRSLRSEAEYYSLESHSLSTIEFEGDKSYGSRMGLWSEIQSIEGIDWNTHFVVKPDAGCRCENVHLFKPGKNVRGFSSRAKIVNAIERKEVKYIQPYFAPEKHQFLPEEYQLIRRCYAVYSLQEKSYKIIGGLWEARPDCHKVHGASDAVCGPLVVS